MTPMQSGTPGTGDGPPNKLSKEWGWRRWVLRRDEIGGAAFSA